MHQRTSCGCKSQQSVRQPSATRLRGKPAALARRRLLQWFALPLFAHTSMLARVDAADTINTPALPRLRISREQLAERINERFPLSIRFLGVEALVASSPRLALLPQRNRIGTEVDLRAGEGSPPGLPTGLLGISYGLRYEASDFSVRLTGVRAERIEIGPMSVLQQQAGPMAAAIVGEALADLIVYTLPAAQRQLLQGLGLEPGEFSVADDEVIIQLRRKRA